MSDLGVRWLRVNEDGFEYAVRQGMHGDEFVKLWNGDCVRRPAGIPGKEWAMCVNRMSHSVDSRLGEE